MSEDISQVPFYKAKCQSIIQAIGEAEDGTGRVTETMADHFNKLLFEITGEFAQLKKHAPDPIAKGGPFARMGITNTSIVDLRAFALQLEQLLDVVESQGTG